MYHIEINRAKKTVVPPDSVTPASTPVPPVLVFIANNGHLTLPTVRLMCLGCIYCQFIQSNFSTAVCPCLFLEFNSNFLIDLSNFLIDQSNFLINLSNFLIYLSNFLIDLSNFIINLSNFLIDLSDFLIDLSNSEQFCLEHIRYNILNKRRT